MDLTRLKCDPNEKPLEKAVSAYSFTSIFRKIAFIGDSMSSGEFQVTYPNGLSKHFDMFEYSWGQYIARKNGLKAYNFSKGGMTAKEYMVKFAESQGYWAIDKACQAYVIALGINDIHNQRMEIGSLNDIDWVDYRKNKPTFAGYYAQIVSRYKEISPDAKFFFVGIPRMENESLNYLSESVAALLQDFSESFENSYFLDLYHFAPRVDEEFRQKYFLSGHMNPMGYILFAEAIDSYIDYIIRHHMEDFSTASLINSGVQYKV